MIWNEAKECMSRDEMRALQSARLKKAVDRVYHNVEYYRKKMQMLVAKEKVAVYSKHVSKRLDEKEDDLRLLLENKDYETLSKEFKDYIKTLNDYEVNIYDNIGDGIAVLKRKY